jgi:hypothetical protein
MAHASWTATVIVQFPYQERRTITGPFDPMTCLTDRWPNMSGLKFLKARTACRAALDDRLTVSRSQGFRGRVRRGWWNSALIVDTARSNGTYVFYQRIVLPSYATNEPVLSGDIESTVSRIDAAASAGLTVGCPIA